jgi:hypothetical protein
MPTVDSPVPNPDCPLRLPTACCRVPGPYSLFPIPYSLFPIPYSLFPIPSSYCLFQRAIVTEPYSQWEGKLAAGWATKKWGFDNLVVWSVSPSVLGGLGKAPEGRSRPADSPECRRGPAGAGWLPKGRKELARIALSLRVLTQFVGMVPLR